MAKQNRVLPSGWFKFAAESDRDYPGAPDPHPGTVAPLHDGEPADPSPEFSNIPAQISPEANGPVDPAPVVPPPPPAAVPPPPRPEPHAAVVATAPAAAEEPAAPGMGPFALFPSRNGYRLLYVPADGGPPVDIDGLKAPALRQLRALLDGVISAK